VKALSAKSASAMAAMKISEEAASKSVYQPAAIANEENMA
jgi:hypothetical protein